MINTKKRTLIFSFDGTGNEPSDSGKFEEDESISNVMKLNILMGGGFHKDDSGTMTPEGNQQITYYYNGIGTRNIDEWIKCIPLLGWLISKIESFINMTFAPKFGDVEEIMDEAMKDFEETQYEPGDTLAVFGFSRGAALARKFAARVLAKNKNCKVSFLGVFDTVAAMDGVHRKGEHISSDVVFENGTLNKSIARAVHIVSLDENRIGFAPTLINKDKDDSKRILEVWFPGVHSDIGGGYWFDGLSDVALDFMIKECKCELGDRIHIADGKDPSAIRMLIEKQKNELSVCEVDDVVINPIFRGVEHLHSKKWKRLGGLKSRVVCVNDKDRPSENENDFPVVHISVKERFNTVANYRPRALRGLKFKILDNEGKITPNPINGISELRQ